MILKIKIDDIHYNLDCSLGETIADVLERNTIDYPGSCKIGICSTCKCRILSGQSEMIQNYVLTDKEIKSGFVLSCQGVIEGNLEVDFDY